MLNIEEIKRSLDLNPKSEITVEIKDSDGRVIFEIGKSGFWLKRRYDERGNNIYYEDWTGVIIIKHFDNSDRCLSYKNSNGYWYEREWDKDNNLIYHESVNGIILDKR